ncbi:mechanosensitive ion channel family protein [Notoacmeibacter ruber]|uniref:Small-conductance mechanosensitive channel n=1 Tax=Notoacmeibacter ruber TaxID=2670375 RepID=A0A3L7JFD4_9HYPH|nr:mechanosensitive ion channel family protein [Notoacmeibacter ruber]RLQ88291.1 mechanosensitive ion channel family protein [Notoacmeibacter ruber]
MEDAIEAIDIEPVNILEDQLRGMAAASISMLPQIIVAILVIVATGILAASARWLLKKGLKRTGLRSSLQELFVMLLGIGIWVLGIMVAAVVMFPSLTPASMLAGLGIGTVAIGFAFKDIFENFLAGIIILFRKEMRTGDFIECEGIEGRVQRISVRETHIRRTDGQLIIVPNAMLFTNPLRIVTDMELRRTTIIAGIAYGEDVDEAREVIRHAVESCDTVIRNAARPIQIFAQEFADSSINFEVTWWTGSKPVDERKSRDEVVAAVKRALDNAGIEIPFPYRTLTFKEPLPLLRGDGSAEKEASPGSE